MSYYVESWDYKLIEAENAYELVEILRSNNDYELCTILDERNEDHVHKVLKAILKKKVVERFDE